MVTLTGSPFKGNQLKAETGKIVHFWLLVEPRDAKRQCRGDAFYDFRHSEEWGLKPGLTLGPAK